MADLSFLLSCLLLVLGLLALVWPLLPALLDVLSGLLGAAVVSVCARWWGFGALAPWLGLSSVPLAWVLQLLA